MLQDQPLCFDEIKVLVTSGCNLNCTHCFRSEDKNVYSLSNEQLLEIVDFAAYHKTQSLSFSGGEFFVHPFSYQLLEYCFSKHLLVRILTNATDIDTAFFDNDDYKGLVSFQVSVDGTEKTHDRRRGSGSYRAMMRNVEALATMGIGVGASTVLDCYNYRDTLDIISLPYFTSFNFLPMASTNATNRYMDNMSHDALSEYEETIRILYQRKNVHAGTEHRCHMYPQGLGISFDGGVYPCAVARDYGLLKMGNLNEQSLESIIEGFPQTDNGRIVLGYLCNDIDECKECADEQRCNRGCRVRALKYFGDILRPDPYCCRIIRGDHKSESINRLFWGEKPKI